MTKDEEICEKLKDELNELSDSERKNLAMKYESVTNDIYSGLSWSEQQERVSNLIAELVCMPEREFTDTDSERV